MPISKVDLSKEKLFYRLNYLKDEIQNKQIDIKLIDRCEKFVEDKYREDINECIIHGDLKSPHIIPTLNGIKFIDFALARTTNPLYDLSFLCMEEQRDKDGIFKRLLMLHIPVYPLPISIIKRILPILLNQRCFTEHCACLDLH